MKERWSYRDYSSYDCLDGMCTREQLGAGTASAHLQTRRPFPMMVIRGAAGQAADPQPGVRRHPHGRQLVRGGDDDREVLRRLGRREPGHRPRRPASAATARAAIRHDRLVRRAGVAASAGRGFRALARGLPLRPPQRWTGRMTRLSLYRRPASVGKGKFLGTSSSRCAARRPARACARPTQRPPLQEDRQRRARTSPGSGRRPSG